MFLFHERCNWKCLFLFHDWFPLEPGLYPDTIFLRCNENYTSKSKYLLELIKRRSKVQENNLSCERSLYFDQWKTFSETYKPMKVWLWLIYGELLSLATFLRVHSNLEEVSYLSWQNTDPNLKPTCHIKLKFFLWTKLVENLFLAKYLIFVVVPLMMILFLTDPV